MVRDGKLKTRAKPSIEGGGGGWRTRRREEKRGDVRTVGIMDG